jgi:transposase
MILHAAEGMPNDEIAACLDTRREVVSLWRKRFFADRLAGWKNTLVRVAPGLFPPDLVVQVKALACELPAQHGRPLSRWSTQDLVQQVQQSGLVASVSGSTLWRWLHEDAIRPWYHRSWIFPATRISPPRPGACWISTPASGKAGR